MEYLFLRRKKTSSTSVRQKTLLYRAAGREWTARFSSLSDVRPADSLIYKGILCISWRYVGRSSIPLFR